MNAAPPSGRLRALAVLALGLLAGTIALACGSKSSSPTPVPTATSPSVSATAVVATRTPATATTVASTPSGGGTGQVNNEPVGFQTDDGVTIRGHLYTTPGPVRRVVIFTHEYPKDQTAWTDFARSIVIPGTAALTFDFRGYGETGGAKDVTKIDKDLDAAVRFMLSRDYSIIDLVGASMGGTAAIKVAAKEQIDHLVTLSAPTDFMGLDCRPDVPNVRAPKLFLAARDDDDAPAAVTYFLAHSSDPKGSQIFDGSAHGTDLLQGPTASTARSMILSAIGE